MRVNNKPTYRTVIHFTAATIYSRHWAVYVFKRDMLQVAFWVIRILTWCRIIRNWNLSKKSYEDGAWVAMKFPDYQLTINWRIRRWI